MAASRLLSSAQIPLGVDWYSLIRRLLSWDAKRRGGAEEALVARLFYPERLMLALPVSGEAYADPSSCSFHGGASFVELFNRAVCARDFGTYA